jgi:hypothetical protein
MYLRGAANIGLGTTTKYLRSSTSAAVIGLGTTIKYLVILNAGAGNNWAKAHDKKAVYEFSGIPCSVAAFVVNEHALTHHTLASKEQLTRPANWDSMTRKTKKNWNKMQARNRGTKQS